MENRKPTKEILETLNRRKQMFKSGITSLCKYSVILQNALFYNLINISFETGVTKAQEPVKIAI